MAKWIWHDLAICPDDYCEFVSEFKTNSEKITINIAADSNYAIYINDEFIDCGQYACYPYAPVMDKINIDVKPGINKLKIIVYYVGVNGFSTYYLDKPGLFFTIYENNAIILESDENIKSCRSKVYHTNLCQQISPQLGYSFLYDANYENENLDYHNSIIVDKPDNFTFRENKKLVILDKVQTNYLINEDNHFLIDLNKEQTGFIYLDFVSNNKQKILVAFGEHIKDGKVRQIIDNRNFSFTYVAKKGHNSFFCPFRRFGCRYLEVFFEKPINVNYIGLIPTVYPFSIINKSSKDELENKIYQTCVYTLICCYHEHYEDCPWREQSFYALDSRNQMLAGYFAFKNIEQARSSLKLIAYDNRKDGLLSICYPSSFNLTIPSFSLHYFSAIYEYYKYTNDISLLQEVYPKLKKLVNAFIKNIQNGLVNKFMESCHWNFYEWQKSLDYPNNEDRTDLIINCLLILALENMAKITYILNKNGTCYLKIANKIKKQVNKTFYNSHNGLYFMSLNDKSYSVLGNSLAILANVANNKKSNKIAKKIISCQDDLSSVTLSMKCFEYDALLSVDKKYQSFILNDIKTTYKKMLDDGATTFYETENGDKDFNNAGSLCHGWSAMPIYYYNLFKIVK